jgi:hypothetical protein
VATYLYDEDVTLTARLCAGTCLGLAALGLIGFVVASFISLSGIAILISAAICCSPIAIATDSRYSKTDKTGSRNCSANLDESERRSRSPTSSSYCSSP